MIKKKTSQIERMAVKEPQATTVEQVAEQIVPVVETTERVDDDGIPPLPKKRIRNRTKAIKKPSTAILCGNPSVRRFS